MEMEILEMILTNAVPFCVIVAYLLTGIWLLMDWAREDKENKDEK